MSKIYEYVGVWYDDRPGVPAGWVARYKAHGDAEIDTSLTTRRRDGVKAAVRETARMLGVSTLQVRLPVRLQEPMAMTRVKKAKPKRDEDEARMDREEAAYVRGQPYYGDPYDDAFVSDEEAEREARYR